MRLLPPFFLWQNPHFVSIMWWGGLAFLSNFWANFTQMAWLRDCITIVNGWRMMYLMSVISLSSGLVPMTVLVWVNTAEEYGTDFTGIWKQCQLQFLCKRAYFLAPQAESWKRLIVRKGAHFFWEKQAKLCIYVFSCIISSSFAGLSLYLRVRMCFPVYPPLTNDGLV